METSQNSANKQTLYVATSIHTTAIWKLLVSFAVEEFGPNSSLWGILADKATCKNISLKFEQFYNDNRHKFENSPKFRKLLEEDLIIRTIYAEIENKVNDEEEKKIDVWFKNLDAIIALLRDYSSRRQASPPYEAYKIIPVSELDIIPSKISYSLLFDK